ncbi:hypothetical protein GIB67_005585 [Kingdonia uniflora]|uniref:Uncharacterized protein n=1 Tax=Kingdonia uniflora TaxID=39325 RepID=A0A7J7MMF9_9MAGN|nr:hypothetical protein GIB67_005585 [Kingdonia uniflora]
MAMCGLQLGCFFTHSQALLSTLPWKLSISSSSKGHLHPFLTQCLSKPLCLYLSLMYSSS